MVQKSALLLFLATGHQVGSQPFPHFAFAPARCSISRHSCVGAPRSHVPGSAVYVTWRTNASGICRSCLEPSESVCQLPQLSRYTYFSIEHCSSEGRPSLHALIHALRLAVGRYAHITGRTVTWSVRLCMNVPSFHCD